MTEIRKILIANRGEIALRIMRSLKEMNIATVAVYSEADRNSPHVRYADEALAIGPAPSAQSYLNMEKIIQAALKSKCQAIHPGYGFLSENAAFSEKVKQAGLIFIGPSPAAIRTMGSKLAAKEAAAKFNIPMVPGGNHAVSDLKEAREVAKTAGYPILIKASAGGGGKGMRVVEKEAELEEQLNRASSEALSAFGDGSVFIEKYISSPRHIEIQVMADEHGNTVYLFERECSIQRRHQKVVEEAPSVIITPEIRKAMGEAAVKVAQSCNYTGAGTVEFIMDENKNFYFLEMNTRLQVEHPVTELITGVDLVKEQVRVAEGKKLSFHQDELQLKGHAIELRVCAEDPANNFLPHTGTIHTYKKPEGPGVRVDDGIEEGSQISVFYDPMIAKLIVYGKDRSEAIERMKRAIDEYQISGIETTLTFGKYVMNHEAFVKGNFDTHFIKKHFKPEDLLSKPSKEIQEIAAALAGSLLKTSSGKQPAGNKSVQKSKWKTNRL